MELWYTEQHTENVRFSIKVEKELHTEQTEIQRIDVLEAKEFGKFFTLDGLMMITEKDEFIYHDMIVHVPMAVNPTIKKVLVIGGGDGGTVRELTRYNSIESIDLVDIDERVVRLCEKYLPLTASKFEDPRVSTYFEDGVAFVKTREDYYDLILVDSTDPIGPGEGLFTSEFYKDCYKALNSNGILINQHESPYFNNYALEMQKAHKKLKSIFDVCKVYQFHMPTYASGHWLFGFASKGLDPIKDHKKEEWESLGLITKYYNSGFHFGSFQLPSYVQNLLENA